MTIELLNVSKSYPTNHGHASILKNVNLKVEQGEHVGILGQNGAGKSTLIRILSGSERPTSGDIRQDMAVSWPLAFGGAFLGGLTGADNVRFVCRLYGVDPAEKMPFIEEFTELGKYLREPVKTYSSGMRARLAFGVSMAVDFDCYLIDEIVAVGDDRFQRKCQFELFEKRRDRAMLIVSHSADFVRQHCQRASVLSAGELTNFSTIDEAYAFYASHEMAMQPHMAGNELPVPKIRPDALEYLSLKYAELGPGPDFEDILEQTSMHLVPVFDSCDVIGRLAGAGNKGAAMCIAEFLTSRAPDEPLFWVTLGDLLCGRRQHVQGVTAYESALRIAPGSYWAHRNLATEYFNVGRYVDAIPHFAMALDLAPQDPSRIELLLRLVDCHFLLDRVSEFQRAIDLAESPCQVIDRHGAILSGSGAARLSVAGLSEISPRGEQLRCTFIIGDERIEGRVSFARNSIRRLASISSRTAFCFDAYLISPPDVTTYEIEIWRGDRKVYEATQPLQLLDRAVDVQRDDMLASARNAYSLHDSELSLICYGVSERLGQGSDIIPFAESLILQGQYDEAEHRLRRWLRKAPRDAPDRGFVLDLLCAEIARARLPGWRKEIDHILDHFPLDTARANVEANRGHSAVAHGDLSTAVGHYQQASTDIGKGPLIHFARGIHTARFGIEVPSPETQLPVGAAEREAGIVHLFACDGGYFERFGKKLVESSSAAQVGTALQIHAHIVDPTEAALEVAQELQRSHKLVVTREDSPKVIRDHAVRRAYYTCARFLQASSLLQTYQRPILITETDCLINWSWSDVLAYVGDADVGYLQSAMWNWVPWTKVAAGIYLVTPSPAGMAVSNYIARFIEFAFKREGGGGLDLWTVDQVALWLAHVNAPVSTKRIHLPMSSVLTLATGDKLNI